MTFESNIINIYGNEGKEWLQNLHKLVDYNKEKYGLSELKAVQNLSYNYVLTGLQGLRPIVLKLGLDKDALKREAEALKAFEGFGGVEVLNQDEGLLLLERAMPGTSLKECNSLKQPKIEIASKVMKKLHNAPIPPHHHFPHMRDWLKVLDKNWNLPQGYLEKARSLRDKLLKNQGREVLLHGDLHHDNILLHENSWVIIDPKGVVGYPLNEVWSFVIDMEKDIPFIANFFGFNVQDVFDWYFVHLVLATCWNLEDNLDATLFMGLAEKAYVKTTT
jgi:streptomycin 6-kinase